MEPVDTLQRRAEKIRTQRWALLPFWQEVAEQFHPTRAQFTRQYYLSEQFMDIQLSSFPMLGARELQDTFAAMLRPRNQDWFQMTVERPELLDRAGRAWLEWASGVMRRAMYDREAGFTRATKETDQDYAVFGNAVISRETDLRDQHLLYRGWHLKDTVWAENHKGQIDEVYRWWRPSGVALKKQFPKSYPKAIDQWIEQEPYREVLCLHAVIPGEQYDRLPLQGEQKPRKSRTPWVSIYVSVEHGEVIEEIGVNSRIYTIPRWQTVQGSPWAFSPGVIAALPDARLIQAMTLTIMEAGEVTVRPPLVATQEAVRSEIALFAGGVTWVDAEYDERLGEALRPLQMTSGQGIQTGMELIRDAREMLTRALYLDRLKLPQPSHEMTATEINKRLEEWRIAALPLFEPVEAEYNAALCEDTASELFRLGAFGPWRAIPVSVLRQINARGQGFRFRFESPIHQAVERQKGAQFLQAAQLLQQAIQIDPNVAPEFDAAPAFRDALTGIGTPATWMRDPAQVAAIVAQRQQQQDQALRTQQLANAGQAAESMGRAVQSFQGQAA